MTLDESGPKIELLQGVIEDGVADLLYYNRKSCDELSVDDVKQLIESGEVTRVMILTWFTLALNEALKKNFTMPPERTGFEGTVAKINAILKRTDP